MTTHHEFNPTSSAAAMSAAMQHRPRRRILPAAYAAPAAAQIKPVLWLAKVPSGDGRQNIHDLGATTRLLKRAMDVVLATAMLVIPSPPDAAGGRSPCG